MKSARELIRTYVCYTDWANKTMVEACASLPSLDLERDLGASHGSLINILRHTYLSDLAWRDRILRGELPALADIAVPNHYSGAALEFTVADLQKSWPAIPASLLQWLDSVTDTDLDLVMPCLLPSGGALQLTRAEIILHDLNHGTVHRGQVVSLLRSLGIQPPNIDVFSFYMRRTAA